MPAGRPLIIASPDELDTRADTYFAACEGKPMTVTGLALALGLSSRESLDEYGRRPEFSDSVKRAKAHVQAAYEARLSEAACTGAIFALKNMGWSDKQEIEHSGSVDLLDALKAARTNVAKPG